METGATNPSQLLLRWDGSVVELQAGDRVRIETPGGGGWGIQK